MNVIASFKKITTDYKNWPLLILNHFNVVREPVLEHKSGTKTVSRNRSDSKTIQAMFDGSLYDKKFIKMSLSGKPGTVIDIGGHICSFSLWADYLESGNHFIIYEPDKDNCRIAMKNKKINNKDNFSILNQCIGGKSGVRVFYSYSSNKKSQSSSLIKRDGKSHSYKIKSVVLGDIIEEIGADIKLVKMDCEGAEYQVFQSLNPRLYRKINAFVFEYHDDLVNQNQGQNHQELEKILKKHYKTVKTDKFNKKRGIIYATN